ncbi:MAG: hypothetical protein ACT4P7_09640, partial [Gemmatimonadaceae bacterium]
VFSATPRLRVKYSSPKVALDAIPRMRLRVRVRHEAVVAGHRRQWHALYVDAQSGDPDRIRG